MRAWFCYWMRVSEECDEWPSIGEWQIEWDRKWVSGWKKNDCLLKWRHAIRQRSAVYEKWCFCQKWVPDPQISSVMVGAMDLSHFFLPMTNDLNLSHGSQRRASNLTRKITSPCFEMSCFITKQTGFENFSNPSPHVLFSSLNNDFVLPMRNHVREKIL